MFVIGMRDICLEQTLCGSSKASFKKPFEAPLFLDGKSPLALFFNTLRHARCLGSLSVGVSVTFLKATEQTGNRQFF